MKKQMTFTAAQAPDARSAGGTRGLHSKIENFLTVIPYIRMEDDNVAEIVTPVPSRTTAFPIPQMPTQRKPSSKRFRISVFLTAPHRSLRTAI